MYSKQFKATNTTPITLAAAKDGKKVYVIGLYLMANAACTVTLKNSDASAIGSGVEYYPAANGGAVLPLCPPNPGGDEFWFETTEGLGLTLTLSGSASVSGVLRWGYR